MKVILNTDIPKVGNRYEIKEFKDGYANILISKGLVILATPKALANLENMKALSNDKKVAEMNIFESIISSINNKKIEIKVKANEKGHLFKSVGPRDVVEAIKNITGVIIDESAVKMDHIKELGSHKIVISKSGKIGSCEIIIEKE